MKRLTIILPVLLFLATGMYAQNRDELAKYKPLTVLGDNDPKGEACGEYFRTTKVKKTERVIFRLTSEAKAEELPMTTMSAIYVDKTTTVPRASLTDLPGLPPDKGRMTRLLISKESLDKAPCLQNVAAIIPVADE